MEYVGVIYDIISDQVIERSPIVRATPDAAYADAKALIAVVNQQGEERDAEAGDGSTIGRVAEDDCFVEADGAILWDFPTVDRVGIHPYGQYRGKF